MGDRFNIGREVRELKLGTTFSSHSTTAFHTIKYDFKPASVDLNRTATVDIGSNNQVTVTVPNLESAGVPNTVFKGNQRKYTKECLIIIDKKTGVVTLEKLNHNIQVKKTRSEPPPNKYTLPPQKMIENNTMRTQSKTKVSTGNRKNNMIGFTPRTMQGSPMQQGSPSSYSSMIQRRSPQQAPAWNANNGQATLPSFPILTDDVDEVLQMPGNSNSNTSIRDSNMNINALTSSSSSSSTTSTSLSSGHNNSLEFRHKNKHIQLQYQQQQQQQLQQQSQQQIQQSQQQQHNHQRHHPQPYLQYQTNSSLSVNTNNANNSNSQQIITNNSAVIREPAGQCVETCEKNFVLSSSDSGSSSSSDSSDSESDSESELETHNHPQDIPIRYATTGNYTTTTNSFVPAAVLLHDDLQLSESNSDSDDAN